MCRLFGFRSVIDSKVHTSLVQADNALMSQSENHPDGWGVAYYINDVPHMIKSTDKAVEDKIFKKISGVVSSQSVIAHIRKATHGENTILNSHPFQYGKWIFAHNGNLKNFDDYKDKLISRISKKMRPFILGNTDSEIVFFLLLTFIGEKHCLKNDSANIDIIKSAIENCFQYITQYSGPLCSDKKPAPTENHLTFLLSSGDLMFGFNGGQKLHYSTYKKKCAESGECPFYGNVCENEAHEGQSINHLVFSSEVLVGENIWLEVQLGELLALDKSMVLKKLKINVPFT